MVAQPADSALARTLNGAFRRAILAGVESPRVERLVHRYGMRLGASRFVAGETLDECIGVLRALDAKGFATNTTLLGELHREETEVRRVAEEYEAILERIHREELRTNVAVKLTSLGLDLDEELAFENVSRLAELALELGNFVRIDMEHSPVVDATLRVYRRLRAAGYDDVGCVLQAYLYRSERDLRDLLPLAPNVRIVKGAYREPASVAFPRKSDVDAGFVRLLELALDEAGHTAVATHDERLIEHTIAYAQRRSLPRERFEFQMLYGVRPHLQASLLRRGYKVLVATPYGPDWFPYLMRRLAERPANLGFFLRSLARG